MPLSDTAIRNAKPAEKPRKLADGGGLYIEISPSGGRWWRYRYRFKGKPNRISLGVYPAVGLKDAREKHAEARKLLAAGVDPSEERKKERALNQEENERRKADRIKAALSMRLVIFPDGVREVWQGRKLITKLDALQAHELRDLLNNTTGGQNAAI